MPAEQLKQLGKYQLVDVLGEGAMGVVYRAFDQVLNRYLAIKVMSTTIVSDERLRERFLREARAAGSLQHPNVVTIYDFGEVDDHLFIAMEFVDGEDLAEIIKRREEMTLATKLDLMIDTLNGLAYAHHRGVVHRDIKPANIRVSSDSRAKVMDFGIAHLQKSDLTQSGMLVGTPQYMAPEQISGGEITPATDIFAVGSVLYEFLSYKKPFEGDTLHIILYNIMSVDPPPLGEVLSAAPPALSATVAKSLAKDPHARYPNAVEMAKALSAVRASLGPVASAATLAMRASQNPGLPPTALRTSQIQNMIAAEIAKKQRRTMIMGVAAVGAIALLLWAPWRGSAPATSSTTPSAPAAAATSPPPANQPPTGAPASAPAAAPATPPPSSGQRATTPRASEATKQTGAAVAGAPARQPDTLLISVRATAMSARRRAVEDGATAADLAQGDAALQAAETSIAQSRNSDAIAQLASAGTLWAEAERTARARTAAASAAAERQKAAPPPVITPPPVVNPPPTPPDTASKAVAVDHRPEIERIVAAYARAIQSTNVGEIRRAYPGLTSAQQQQWESFYRIARSFRATLAIDDLAVTGASANVTINALYEYQNTSTGRAERQQFRLSGTLAREAGAWRLTSIR